MTRPSRAVVIGASGLIGAHLLSEGVSRGVSVIGTHRGTKAGGLLPLDITHSATLEALLRDHDPDVVFLAAANSNVDAIEGSPQLARAVNVEAVAQLARIMADRAKGIVVFFSSDYVFDGTEGPYTEEDRPNPLSHYGRQKVEAEGQLRDILPDRHMVLRVTGVYGPEQNGKNFVLRLVREVSAGQRIRAPRDQMGNPTLVDDLAAAAWSLTKLGARGTYHLAGPDRIDRYRFALLTAEAFDLNPSLIDSVNTAELGQPAPRPLEAGMLSDRAQEIMGRPMTGVVDGLRHLKEQLRSNA